MNKIFLFSLLVLMGCNTRYDDPTVVAINQHRLAGQGDTVGTLPDGRKVIRYPIDMGTAHSHWIYVVDNTITVNRTESHGKTTSNHVDVIINGVTYKPELEQQE